MKIELDVSKLYSARLEKGLTQKDLAQLAGVSRVSISYMETKRAVPRAHTLKRVCDALGFKVSDVSRIIN